MKAIKAKNPIPVKLEDWLREIATAYCDARHMPFAELIDDKEKFDEKNIFHLHQRFEFRGIRKTKDIIRQTTEAALSSYRYADHTAEVFRSPIMAFACYVGSHWDRADYGKDGHSI